MKQKAIAILLSSIIVAIFYFNVIGGPSAFNLLPYTIYYYLAPNGHNESNFIKWFDIFLGIFLFFILYKIFYTLSQILTRKIS